MTVQKTLAGSPVGAPADADPELAALYQGFHRENLIPLWTEIGDLMPPHPRPRAVPYLWRWRDGLLPMARKAGELVPVGRGGERRAIALANPGLGGAPFATPTLWAAVQYLNPGEDAPVHRHTQNAFRFVVEGEGVWTVVNGDPVAMRRGDFLPQAGWNWHGHHNVSDAPMAWIDGLDIPFQHYVGSTFFEPGPEQVETRAAPPLSRSERLWGHPGLRPLSHLGPVPATPLLAYRWEHTDRALTDQLALEAEGYPATVETGHAAVRYVNPATGGDVLPTIRAEIHRLVPGTRTAPRKQTGSAVCQVFDGAGEISVGDESWRAERGDLFAVPSWHSLTIATESGLDLFLFTDAPMLEKLHQDRAEAGEAR